MAFFARKSMWDSMGGTYFVRRSDYGVTMSNEFDIFLSERSSLQTPRKERVACFTLR